MVRVSTRLRVGVGVRVRVGVKDSVGVQWKTISFGRLRRPWTPDGGTFGNYLLATAPPGGGGGLRPTIRGVGPPVGAAGGGNSDCSAVRGDAGGWTEGAGARRMTSGCRAVPCRARVSGLRDGVALQRGLKTFGTPPGSTAASGSAGTARAAAAPGPSG